MLFWVLFFSMLMCGQCSKDVKWPEDREATVGSDVVFNCTSPSGRPIGWHHLPIGYLIPEISHQDGSCLNGYCERYSMVNNTPGEYSLRIRNVSIDDAGTHRCDLGNDQRGAELNVIEIYPSNETCSAQIPKDGVIGHNQCQLEPDRITLSCSLRSVGNVKTFLEWTQPSANDIDFKIVNNASGGTITSTLILEDRHLQEATFLCRIRHLKSNLTSPFEWRNHIKTVPLRLRNATVDSDAQQIDCSSELPFKCSSSWMHDGHKIASSQMLNLTGKKNGKYICYATCDVRGRSCTFQAYEVTYQRSDHTTVNPSASNTGLIVGIVVAVFVPMLVIGLIIACVLLKRRKLACFSETPPAIEDRGEDQNEIPPAKNVVRLPQENRKKGEESNKLLEGNCDEEQNGRRPILNFDDQTEVNISDITSASHDYNIQLRNIPDHEEATDRQIPTELDTTV